MKPPVLGSSGLALLMERDDGKNSTDAFQTGAKGRSRDQTLIVGNSSGSAGPRNGVGMCGSWCLWPSICPCAEPIYPPIQSWAVQFWAEGALGGISLRRKSISAREGRNGILITPEVKSFRRIERCTYLWVFCLVCMETFQKQMAEQRFISR